VHLACSQQRLAGCRLSTLTATYTRTCAIITPPRQGVEYCDQFVCLSVCLSAGSIFTKLCVRIPCGRGSVLLWRRCDMLCILPVLWMTSRMAVMGATPKGGSRHSATAINDVAIPGRSLMSMNACFVFCIFPLCYCLVVSTGAIDCLERLVSEMAFYVSSWTLIHTHSRHDFSLSPRQTRLVTGTKRRRGITRKCNKTTYLSVSPYRKLSEYHVIYDVIQDAAEMRSVARAINGAPET